MAGSDIGSNNLTAVQNNYYDVIPGGIFVLNNLTFAMITVNCKTPYSNWITVAEFDRPTSKPVSFGYYNPDNIELMIMKGNSLKCAGGKAGGVYNVTFIFSCEPLS